jgi:arylsulfatase A-like enzyme
VFVRHKIVTPLIQEASSEATNRMALASSSGVPKRFMGSLFLRRFQASSSRVPFAASHARHHAPKDWIDRYKGQLDTGWDAIREIVHAWQIELGLVPEGLALPSRDPDVPAWDSLTEEQQRIYCRFMEAFTGMTLHMDHQVGRLLDFLKDLDELDNTIVVVLSDDGASAEGGAVGSFNNQQLQGQVPQLIETEFDIDRIGGPESYIHYPLARRLPLARPVAERSGQGVACSHDRRRSGSYRERRMGTLSRREGPG